jgi:DNA-binding CsgD family transcriptional regulator
MKRLTNRETQSLLNAVSSLHAYPIVSDVHERILQATREVLAAEWYALDCFHPQGFWLNQNWQMPFNSATPKDVENFGRYAHEHPLFRAFVETGLPEPRKTTDFVSTQRFQRLGIYNEFFRPVGTDRQLLTGLPVSSTLTLVLSLNRKSLDFTESSRNLLTMLRPHLITAYQNAEAFTQLQLQRGQLEVALETSGGGAILLDAAGRVRLVTTQARRWLASYFTNPHGSAEDLPEELASWLAHLTTNSTQDSRLAAPVSALETVRPNGRLQLRLLRDDLTGHSMLLMEEDVAISASEIEKLGLTKREAEILSWVAQGKTNPEISILCAISDRTVHKHLEHIYQKLGVENRTAAAQKVLNAKKQGGRPRIEDPCLPI